MAVGNSNGDSTAAVAVTEGVAVSRIVAGTEFGHDNGKGVS